MFIVNKNVDYAFVNDNFYNCIVILIFCIKLSILARFYILLTTFSLEVNFMNLNFQQRLPFEKTLFKRMFNNKLVPRKITVLIALYNQNSMKSYRKLIYVQIDKLIVKPIKTK